MARLSAGDLDRRVMIEEAQISRDAAGDEIKTWQQHAERWAGMRQLRGFETQAAQQLVRGFDCVFTVREDAITRTIAPETMRIVHRGREYLIVGVQRTADRDDGLDLLCSSRPDMRGAAAPESGSGEL
jgi:head-tail adaptor